MPADETAEFFKKSDIPGHVPAVPSAENGNGADSHICNVSLRGWLALLLVATLCFMSMRALEVKEPLYTIVTVAVSFYFGQKTKT